MKELPVNFKFSEAENAALTATLQAIRSNPYTQYDQFAGEVGDIVRYANSVPAALRELCQAKARVNRFEDPYVYLKNCPVDPDLPELGLDSPVVSKRRDKKTFVAEGFLEMYARLMGQEPIGYVNVNDGDIFQDIHPMRSMLNSQSQKASGNIYFHKDLTNHFVRPDWVNILGLRSSPENQINTCFVRNKDLLEFLDPKTRATLTLEEFHTPFDDLTLSSDNRKLDEAPPHPVLGGSGEYDIRFFENRTRGLSDRARAAVAELTNALHELKVPLQILKGDFIGSANNECIHCKEIVRVRDEDAMLNRWLMKTVNVRILDIHKRHMVPGEVRVING